MGKLIVASYCSTFLKPEMMHLYRQVTSLRRTSTFVMTKKVEHSKRFPFDDIERIPRPRTNLLRHGWMKLVQRQPALIYRGEYKMLVSVLGRRGADMMHIYFGHAGVHLLPFIRGWDKPCIVSFHGMDVAQNPQVANYAGKLRQLFQEVPLVLARSQSLAQRLINFGCPPEKIRLNRTGIPLADFSYKLRSFPLDGRWRVLQACRLIDKKGVGSAISAFGIFAKAFPAAELFIAGKGPLQEDLEFLAQQLGVGDRVHFIGFLGQRALRDFYARGHFFIHPSETPPDENQEGVPNSILEAMATGLPVIATRHGGIPEAVTHEVNGFLSAERDIDSLGRSMIALASSPARYASMSAAARNAVAQKFDQELTVRALEDVYEEVCARPLLQEREKPVSVLPAAVVESA
ncbi:MAG: colanic acid biosynthesis glycosyltransferase WcaL [Chthoniobacterales bacterium]|nr:MAG: colanic acid biosynthesis glycosyltransferase WcaL [Chthoniobacterales bacterium]